MKEQVSVEVFSPTKAQKIIDENNIDNRKIRQQVVEKYARDMKAGGWLFNGNSIVFDADGKLIDGQHRLLACSKSGINLRAVVVRGVSDDSKYSIDTGAKRNFADVLHYLGYTDRNQLAAVVRFCWSYETGNILSGIPPTHQELLSFLEENPDLPVSQRKMGTIKLPYGCIKTVVSAIHYYSRKGMPGEATAFASTLRDFNGLAPGDPIHRLITWLQWNDAGSRTSPPIVVQGVVIKAWNAHIEGRTISNLKFSPRGIKAEPFPTIVSVYPGVIS